MILIAGPCVIENKKSLDKIAEELASLLTQLPGIDFYFKASCVKDNRTKLSNYYGPGFKDGMDMLLNIRDTYNLKVTTDFHNEQQIRNFSHAVDLIQIPAFLARQTSIITAAARAMKPIHVKKPQFMSPMNVSEIYDKIFQINSDIPVFISDRGTCFGYDFWMCDPRHFRMMKTKNDNIKVLADITHPNQSYGDYSYAYELGMSAISSGADGIFLETHENPIHALCDGNNQIPLNELYSYLEPFHKLFEFLKHISRSINA